MKTILNIPLAAVVLAGAVLASAPAAAATGDNNAEAQPGREVTTHNAALLYFRYWLIIGDELDGPVHEDGKSLTLSDESRAALDEHADSIAGLLKASRQDSADWGIEYERGPDAVLGHLSSMRQTIKVFAADAIYHAERGDRAGAAERVAAMVRSATHLEQDRTLISALVGLSIGDHVSRLVDKLFESGQLGPDDAGSILAALNRVDGADPFGIRAALEAERDLMSGFFADNFRGPDAGRRLVEAYLPSDDESLRDAVEAVSEFDGAALREDLRGFERFYDDVQGYWDQPNSADVLAMLSADVDAGEYGPTARLFAANPTRVRQNSAAYAETLARTIATLEGKP